MQFVLSCSSGVVGCAMMMSVEKTCNFHTNVILLMLIFWWTFSSSVVLRSDCTHTRYDMYENSEKKSKAAWTLLSVHSTFPNFFFNRFRGNISLFFRFHFQTIFSFLLLFYFYSRQQIFHFSFFLLLFLLSYFWLLLRPLFTVSETHSYFNFFLLITNAEMM